MQIAELLKLTEWFRINIVNEGIPQKYSVLHNRMNQNLRVNQNQTRQPFQNERDALIESLNHVSFNSLSIEQISLIEKLDIIQYLGIEGVGNIEKTLFENNLDIATATRKIGEFSNAITNAQARLQEIEETLKKTFEPEVDTEVPKDTVLMRVYFQQDSSIRNITDFKRLSNQWYEIGRGIAMAQDKSPEDFSIIGAQKGSVIIEMVLYAGLATTVSSILLAGLKVADRVLEILKKAEELKALKLNNKKIENELQKEAENEKSLGIQTILNELTIQLNLNTEQQGDKISALEKSITKLIDFTQKGGMIDFVQQDGNDSNSEKGDNPLRNEISRLNTNISQIRSLENRIKMIESSFKNKN